MTMSIDATESAPKAPEFPPPAPPEAGTERFDQLVQVVRPWMAWALGVSMLTIAGALLWSVFALITTSVSQVAALLPATGFVQVAAPVSGLLATVSVVEGAVVQAGQVITTVTGETGSTVNVTSSVDGTVEIQFFEQGSQVDAASTLFLITPAKAQVSVVTFLPVDEAVQVEQGQAAVFTSAGCPAYAGTVSGILRAPLTRDQAGARIGLLGLADVIVPAKIGIGIQMNIDSGWCPSAVLGSTGELVVTTGTVHPISYLQP